MRCKGFPASWICSLELEAKYLRTQFTGTGGKISRIFAIKVVTLQELTQVWIQYLHLASLRTDTSLLSFIVLDWMKTWLWLLNSECCFGVKATLIVQMIPFYRYIDEVNWRWCGCAEAFFHFKCHDSGAPPKSGYFTVPVAKSALQKTTFFAPFPTLIFNVKVNLFMRDVNDWGKTVLNE